MTDDCFHPLPEVLNWKRGFIESKSSQPSSRGIVNFLISKLSNSVVFQRNETNERKYQGPVDSSAGWVGVRGLAFFQCTGKENRNSGGRTGRRHFGSEHNPRGDSVTRTYVQVGRCLTLGGEVTLLQVRRDTYSVPT